MKNCLFCKIIKGEIPAIKIYEDKKTFAFLDANPTNLGHTLVVPKKHSKNIFDIKEEDLISVFNTTQKIAKALKKIPEVSGINIISNNEKAAGQIIFHTHIHIIPRLTNDGFKQWQGKKKYREGEAEKIAFQIKERII